MLASALNRHQRWVLSGSLCGWGDMFIARFELAVFLYIPHELRMSRIMVRERERYGGAIEPDGALRAHHMEFIEWASKYDTADQSVRSLQLHESWIAALPCRCIRIEGDLSTEERIARIISAR
jgi:cytidylate kinase